MPLLVSYGDIPVTTTFPTDQSVDVLLLSLSHCFHSLRSEHFNISPLVRIFFLTHLPSTPPCTSRHLTSSSAGTSPRCLAMRLVLSALSSCPCSLSSASPNSSHSLHGGCSSLVSTVDSQDRLPHLLAHLCGSILGTSSSAAGQRCS